jgi:hypothetical protein
MKTHHAIAPTNRTVPLQVEENTSHSLAITVQWPHRTIHVCISIIVITHNRYTCNCQQHFKSQFTQFKITNQTHLFHKKHSAILGHNLYMQSPHEDTPRHSTSKSNYAITSGRKHKTLAITLQRPQTATHVCTAMVIITHNRHTRNFQQHFKSQFTKFKIVDHTHLFRNIHSAILGHNCYLQ